MGEDKNVNEELQEELQETVKDELGLTVAPPELTLQEEPIPNPNAKEMAEQQKKGK